MPREPSSSTLLSSVALTTTVFPLFSWHWLGTRGKAAVERQWQDRER